MYMMSEVLGQKSGNIKSARNKTGVLILKLANDDIDASSLKHVVEQTLQRTPRMLTLCWRACVRSMNALPLATMIYKYLVYRIASLLHLTFAYHAKHVI